MSSRTRLAFPSIGVIARQTTRTIRGKLVAIGAMRLYTGFTRAFAGSETRRTGLANWRVCNAVKTVWILARLRNRDTEHQKTNPLQHLLILTNEVYDRWMSRQTDSNQYQYLMCFVPIDWYYCSCLLPCGWGFFRNSSSLRAWVFSILRISVFCWWYSSHCWSMMWLWLITICCKSEEGGFSIAKTSVSFLRLRIFYLYWDSLLFNYSLCLFNLAYSYRSFWSYILKFD